MAVNIRFATAEQEQWICSRMQEIADAVTVLGCKTILSRNMDKPAMGLVEYDTALYEDERLRPRDAGFDQYTENLYEHIVKINKSILFS